MPDKNVKSGAVLGFRVGSQSTVNTMLAAGANAGAIHGTFYLTEDSHRLYVGNEDTSLSPVNEGVVTVASVSALPSITSQEDQKAYTGAFYYATSENILCVFNGQHWVQINRNTNTTNSSFTAVTVAITGGAQLQNTLTDSNGASLSNYVQFKGSNGTVITTGTTTITVGGESVTVPTITVSTKYELQSESKTGGVNLKLKSQDGSNDTTQGLIAGADTQGVTNITITKDGNDVKFVSRDTKPTSVSVTNQSAGFKVQIDDNYGGNVNTTFTPKIKYGDSQSTVDFVNGTATLDVYTKGETQDLLEALNAMTYIGTIGTTGTAATQIDTTGTSPVVYKGTTQVPMHIGDTMLVANQMSLNGQTIYPGSLIIARGTEDNDGVITASTLTFDIVKATNDTDTHYRFIENSTSDGISLRSSTGDTVGTLKFVGDGSLITVSEDTTNLVGNNNDGGVSTTVTVTHANVTRTNTNGTAVSTTKADSSNSYDGSKAVNVITGVTTNATGHVTGVQTTQVTIHDTNSHIDDPAYTASAYSSGTGASAKSVGVLKESIKETYGAGGSTTKNGYSTFSSKSLTFTNTTNAISDQSGASTAAGLNIEMVWGSF